MDNAAVVIMAPAIHLPSKAAKWFLRRTGSGFGGRGGGVLSRLLSGTSNPSTACSVQSEEREITTCQVNATNVFAL